MRKERISMTEREFLADYLKDKDSAEGLLSLSRYVAERGNPVMIVADNRLGGKLGVIWNTSVKAWTVHRSV
jgi:hypothetical protein